MGATYRFTADQLRSLTRRLFAAAGTPEPIVSTVTEILINANLAGHDSHGVIRIPSYLNGIESGHIKPAAEPERIRESTGTLLVDGGNGFGHYTARRAMEWAIEKARRDEICCVSLTRTGHIGRVGEYAEMAARAGCIGFITVGGGSSTGGAILPFGGAQGRLGTNPLAVGVPTGDETPFIIDFATSVIAGGKVMVARSKEVDLPPGTIVDRELKPTVKIADLDNGGFMLPFGAHKGYALSLLICLLGGLAGHSHRHDGSMGGCFMQVIDVKALTPLAEYQQGVRQFLDGIKATPPAPGFPDVLVPGDYEQRSRTERLARGIEVPEKVVRQIGEWAEKLSVPMEKGVAEPAR
jgi:LDH2 family malate/lactate/ureidoglycolate dehydrogenase